MDILTKNILNCLTDSSNSIFTRVSLVGGAWPLVAMAVAMSVAISPRVCTLLRNGPIDSCESFMQLHCTIQNKQLLISIDLTIYSCREFEFTVKTMNALLSERFTDHQRVASTCYSQLQQLKDCTIFPIINYFLVK